MARSQSALAESVWTGAVTTAWLVPIAWLMLEVAFPPTLPVGRLALWVGAAAAGLLVGWRLPSSRWLSPRSLLSPTWYRRLGVPAFASFVFNSPRWKRNLRLDPVRRRDLAALLAYARSGERVHWAALLSSLPLVALARAADKSGVALYLLVANVPFNVYPILLQRDMQHRLTRGNGASRSTRVP